MQASLPAPTSLSLVRRAPLVPRPASSALQARASEAEPSVLVVGPDDDMAMLHSRMERARQRALTLVITHNARILRQPLGFRILRRLAVELGVDVTVVADDRERRRFARRAGFAVRSGAAAPRWRPSRTLVLSALATLVCTVAAAVGLPHTTVRVDVGAAPLTRDATITVDLRPGAPGVGAGWVAGKSIASTFEIEQTLPATGRRAIGQTPANGYVTLTDLRPYTPAPPPSVDPATGALVMPDPQSYAQPERVIPAGAVLLGPDDQRFFTRNEVRLTPSSYATVPVIAEFPGRAGNARAGALQRFEDPKLADMRVENRQPLWGGSDRQEAVVSPENREALQAALDAQAAIEAPARLTGQAGADYLVLPETVTWALDMQYDYAPGQTATQLWGRAVVRAQALGVTRGALDELAARQWRAALPEGVAPRGTPRIAGAPIVREQSDEYLILSIPVQGPAAPRLDTSALAEQLRGQSASAIRTRLSAVPGVRSTPRVDVWPTWAPAAWRIDVHPVLSPES